jgi:glycine/D-amino acid oxidase-like deaminating enzyme
MPVMKSYLIVGQGIAGSLLAWKLIEAGQAVTIIDNNHHESSSFISAGIINPITGQRLALTPQYDLLYKHAVRIYGQIGSKLGADLFIPKPIVRVLRNKEELTRCSDLKSSKQTKQYVGGIHRPGRYGARIHDPFGSLTIAQGGYLQTQLLLKAMKKYFIEQNILIDEQLSYDDLVIADTHVQWRSKTFDKVIFCEGFKAHLNPWFKDLPYNFAKGEILKITFESEALPDAIFCQQQWCLPTQDGTYLVGSTYDRDNINTIATEEGQSAILKGLSDFVTLKANVLEKYAAVRPVMLDQKPIIGFHRSIPTLGIFNGFASKGILWAPYHAEKFSQELS